MKFETRYELVAPILPRAADLQPDIEAALDAKWLSNRGRFVERLERRIESVLGFRHAVLTSSCTLALVITLRALRRSGEVITPAFSFAASAHAIRWAGLAPVLGEVDRTAFNLDPASVARLV